MFGNTHFHSLCSFGCPSSLGPARVHTSAGSGPGLFAHALQNTVLLGSQDHLFSSVRPNLYVLTFDLLRMHDTHQPSIVIAARNP
jgi:hypothetical protein